MKKLIYTGKILTILSLVVLTSCKKDSKVDFPKQATSNGNQADFTYRTPSFPDLKDADGILIAAHVRNYWVITKDSPFEKEFQYGMAKFTNTTGNFSSLADADSVVVDTSNLTKAADYSYMSNPTTYSLNFGKTNTWKVKGAGSIGGTTITDPSSDPTYNYFNSGTTGYPKYFDDTWVPTAPKNPALTHIDTVFNTTPFAVFPIKGYVQNTDSVIVTFQDDNGFSFTKKAAATDSLLTITPNELLNYPSANQNSLTLQINLVKYHNVMVGSKKYYYLKMGSYIKYWKTIY